MPVKQRNTEKQAAARDRQQTRTHENATKRDRVIKPSSVSKRESAQATTGAKRTRKSY